MLESNFYSLISASMPHRSVIRASKEYLFSLVNLKCHASFSYEYHSSVFLQLWIVLTSWMTNPYNRLYE